MIFWNLELWHGIKVSICIKNVKYFSHKLWLTQHIFHLIRLHIFKRKAESAAVVSFPDVHSTFQFESSRYLVSTLLSISTILNHAFAPVTQKIEIQQKDRLAVWSKHVWYNTSVWTKWRTEKEIGQFPQQEREENKCEFCRKL